MQAACLRMSGEARDAAASTASAGRRRSRARSARRLSRRFDALAQGLRSRIACASSRRTRSA